MRAVSLLKDTRINSTNFLVELTIGEYLNFAEQILDRNEYQRKRVSSSKTIYSLLKADIQKGCIMPPLVLAISSELSHSEPNLEEFESFLRDNLDKLLILDGLQRTYTIIDLRDELRLKRDDDELRKLLSYILRAEFYVGLNKLGILYRMLTLNTGQTPMSLRQQIEILYLDYSSIPIDGIELVRETEGRRAIGLSQYNFRDIVEGFNSYLERNEFPIERANILENIKSLEKLSIENQGSDIFKDYVTVYHKFILKLNEYCSDTEISDENQNEKISYFGKTINQVFKKPQAMSGFGAAIGKMKDFQLIEGFDSLLQLINQMEIQDGIGLLENINNSLDWIKNNSKKIGNAQRSYFQYFFREIFNRENEYFLKLEEASESALRKYQSQNI